MIVNCTKAANCPIKIDDDGIAIIFLHDDLTQPCLACIIEEINKKSNTKLKTVNDMPMMIYEDETCKKLFGIAYIDERGLPRLIKI